MNYVFDNIIIKISMINITNIINLTEYLNLSAIIIYTNND